MAGILKRDEFGRIVSSTGRRKGSKDLTPRRHPEASNAQRTAMIVAARQVSEAGEKYLKKALETLGKAAETDPGAAYDFVRMFHALPTKAPISSAAHLANLPPDARIVEANRLLALGKLDAHGAAAITQGARTEIEVGFMSVLRANMRDFEEGRVTMDRVIQALAQTLDRFDPNVIEHEQEQGDSDE